MQFEDLLFTSLCRAPKKSIEKNLAAFENGSKVLLEMAMTTVAELASE